MTVYADSSAVLAWLLTERGWERLGSVLRPPSPLMVSTLTLIECDRVLHRLAALRPGGRPDVDALRARLGELTAGWSVEPIGEPIVARARASFPDDTLRSLDAIHLATALVAQASIPELAVLSLDERIRANARSLGLPVLPA